jgi:hypothetical protein
MGEIMNSKYTWFALGAFAGFFVGPKVMAMIKSRG